MTDTAVRVKPPDVDFPWPPCPMCGEDLEHDGEWYCSHCLASWSPQGHNGSWQDDTAATCGEERNYYTCQLRKGHSECQLLLPAHRDECSKREGGRSA